MPTPSPAPAASPVPTLTWRHRALGLLTALIYPLSHPFAWPGDTSLDTLHHSWTQYLAFVIMTPALLSVRHLPPLRAYLFSMWFMIPGTAILLYWLMVAMVVYGHIPVPLSLALLLLLATAGWQFMGLAIAASRAMEVRWKFPPWLAVPVGWTGMEYARAHVYFGGFPWGNLGASQSSNLPFIQLGALGGVYLIIFILAFSNAVVTEVVRSFLKERPFPRNLVVSLLAVLALSYGWGTWHIQEVDALAAAAPKVRVGMLQGNIEQGIKNQDHLYVDDILRKYEKVQKEALEKGAELIIWPEAAYPPAIEKSERSLAGKRFPSLGNASAVLGSTVYWRDPPTLTGAECKQPKPPRECKGKAYIHNSAVVVSNDLTFLGRFDKTHLVPFGEYVPWPLAWVANQIVPMSGQGVPGNTLEPVEITSLPQKPKVAALVCYEGIFPQYARGFAAHGAELIINVTNDAWYGISSAAPQHLGHYSLRAAETGRAVARVANTGVTAGVDPVGRILSPSEVFTDAAVVVDLPILRQRTLYTYVGDVVGWGCLLPFTAVLALGLQRWYVQRRQRRQPAAA